MDITVPFGSLGPSILAGRQTDLMEIVVLALDGGATEERLRAGCGESAGSSRSDWLLAVIEHGTTVLELSRGEYAAALASTRRRGFGSLLSVTYPNIVEAATRCGQPRTAVDATAVLAGRIAESPAGPGAGLLARCQALIDAGAGAEVSYRDSITRLEDNRCNFEAARTRLLYGEWLRRAKRRGDAREQLRAAAQVFSAMGARTLASRAQVELAATGESARRRQFDTINDLTPQERHIARLAAVGWTNAEIAAALFLSTSTVDYHLRKVFRKLAVPSRRKLSLVLGNGDDVATAPVGLCSA